jgi:hypothetical protein
MSKIVLVMSCGLVPQEVGFKVNLEGTCSTQYIPAVRVKIAKEGTRDESLVLIPAHAFTEDKAAVEELRSQAHDQVNQVFDLWNEKPPRVWKAVTGSSTMRPCMYCQKMTPHHFQKMEVCAAISTGWMRAMFFCDDDCVARYQKEVQGW